MASKERFFLEIEKETGVKTIYRYSSAMMVSVETNIDRRQHICVYFTKNGNKSAYETDWKSTDACIVKPATKEAFYQAYNHNLAYLHENDYSQGECYLNTSNGRLPHGMARFSASEQDKKGLIIAFHNEPKDFTLRIDNFKTWKGIQHFRKAGHVIELSQFAQFYKGVLHFLHDPENYEIHYELLIQQFKAIIVGEQPELPTYSYMPLDHNPIREKIEYRIAAIEKRLIELDSDSREERIKMRGELDGLKFALQLMQQQ